MKAQGFVEDRQSGSHLTLWHGERNVSVTVPSIRAATRVAVLSCGF
ncbi:MAG: type II toxin-antitoxin system HicA family toxin [Terriglobia bacterium]